MKNNYLGRLEQINKELLLVFSLFLIALLLNYLFASQKMLLSLYALPTIGSAYLYGRRHATLTALASVLMVGLLFSSPDVLRGSSQSAAGPISSEWLELVGWGGSLMLTGYMMGTLCEHQQAQLRELRETYHGVLMILRHFVSKDKYTENHSYRVSVYAVRIASHMRLSHERIEDVRAAALLHDIGKLEISRDILYKAAKLTSDEFSEMQKHVSRGVEMLEPVGGSLRRVIPIILAHHDKFDGSGYNPTKGDAIPLEARIISVADVYDSLTSDRPYRKAMPTTEAKDVISKGAGTDFDPDVVNAFMTAFRRGDLEIWSAPLSAA
jgi:putative nucleotidyltransferase with HDIG domain